jgi:hypothetical protein
MLGRLLGNKTPPYQGQTQQAASKRGGLLSFFTGGFALFPKTPVYAKPSPAPVAIQNATTGEPPTETAASHSEDDPINGAHETGAEEPETKRVTIIVTPGPGTTVEDVAAFFRERCGIDD